MSVKGHHGYVGGSLGRGLGVRSTPRRGIEIDADVLFHAVDHVEFVERLGRRERVGWRVVVSGALGAGPLGARRA